MVPSNDVLASLGCNGADYSVEMELKIKDNEDNYRAIYHKGHVNAERTVSIWCRDDILHTSCTATGSANNFANSGAYPVDEWFTYTVVKEGDKLTVYFDGVENHSTKVKGDTVCNDGPFYIGGSPWYDSFGGSMNSLAVYDRSLSADEVNTHADGSVFSLDFEPTED